MGPNTIVGRFDDGLHSCRPVFSIVSILKTLDQLLFLLQGTKNVVHRRPFTFNRPHHAVCETDGLTGVARSQRFSRLFQTGLHFGRIQAVTLGDGTTSLFQGRRSTTKGILIGFDLLWNDGGKVVRFLGSFLPEVGVGIGEKFTQMLDACTLFPVECTLGFKNGRLRFFPPQNDFRGSFFGLTEEEFALPQRAQRNLPLTHVEGFSGTLGNRGDGFGGLNGLECILANDFNIASKRKRSFHVFLAFIEQPHAVHGIHVPFLFGRRQQTGSLGNGCALRFQLQKADLQQVQTLLEPLSLGFLIVAHGPRVHRVAQGKHAHNNGQQPGGCSQTIRLCGCESDSGQRTNTGQNRTVAEDAEVAAHGSVRKLAAGNTHRENEDATSGLC